MAITVFRIHKRVVIDEILVTRIVRRIDVDDINLAFVGITEGGKGFQVVTLYQNMVGSIRLAAQYCLVLYFAEYGKFFTQPFLYIFRFVFPYKSILFVFTQQPDEAATLVIAKTL